MSNATKALPDIRQTVVIKAPIQKVWDAVSTAEAIGEWFMPNNFEPKVGHEFHLDAGPFGKSPCKVTVIDPPHKLSFDWGKDWSLTFELVEQDGATEFTLIHSGWYEGMDTEFGQPHAVVRETMNGGWIGIVKKLATKVEG
ncbi:SRPBCC family protein [Cohnella yongneupensis]|uniref:SRPBCC domain-containing protein n=1 Tax=Cohnella yongneupensis TaxID=425006 RepID=A0ABW0R5L9_9BACL